MVSFLVPQPCVSAANRREHHHARARRVKRERAAAWACTLGVRGSLPAWPWRVTYERLGGRELDYANLVSGFKAFEDGVVVDAGGHDDRPRSGYRGVYEQRKPDPGRGEEGGTVRVTIEPIGGGGP